MTRFQLVWLTLDREKVRELEEERRQLEESLSYCREREERARALLASATQDQGLTHLVDTLQHAQQAELLLKEKVGIERDAYAVK